MAGTGRHPLRRQRARQQLFRGHGIAGQPVHRDQRCRGTGRRAAQPGCHGHALVQRQLDPERLAEPLQQGAHGYHRGVAVVARQASAVPGDLPQGHSAGRRAARLHGVAGVRHGEPQHVESRRHIGNGGRRECLHHP